MTPSELMNQLDEPDRTIALKTLEAVNLRFEFSLKDQPRSARNTKIRKQNAKLKTKLYSEIRVPEEARQQYILQRKATQKISPIGKRPFMACIDKLVKHRSRLSGSGGKGLTSYIVQKDARSPDKWQRVVAAVRNRTVRAQVACLVWWDFFAIRTRDEGNKYWAHLDEFMEDWEPGVPLKDLAHALINCGYHPYDAALRLTGGEANR